MLHHQPSGFSSVPWGYCKSCTRKTTFEYPSSGYLRFPSPRIRPPVSSFPLRTPSLLWNELLPMNYLPSPSCSFRLSLSWTLRSYLIQLAFPGNTFSNLHLHHYRHVPRSPPPPCAREPAASAAQGLLAYRRRRLPHRGRGIKASWDQTGTNRPSTCNSFKGQGGQFPCYF